MSDADKGIAQEQQLTAFTPLSIKEPYWIHVNMSGDDGFQSLNQHSYRLVPMVKEYTPNPHPLMVTLGQRVCMAITNINADALARTFLPSDEHEWCGNQRCFARYNSHSTWWL